MSKKLLCLLLSFILAFALCSCGGETTGSESQSNESTVKEEDEKNVDYSTYDSYWMKQFDYKTMPIGAYNAAPNGGYTYTDNFASYDSLATLADCGINTVYALYEKLASAKTDVLNILDACEKLNLSYMATVIDSYNQTNKLSLKSAVSKVIDSPALGGFMVCDEPGYTLFSRISKSVATYSEVAPDLLYHTNLFPDYASQKQLYFRTAKDDDVLPEGGYTYEQYVDDYLEICKPQVLSYDSYPFRGTFPKLMSGYFANLSVIRNKASGAGIPFWIFIQCYGNGGGTRTPVGSELLWQVNTGLSYGSKGIQYFCYYLPAELGETFRGCLVDYSGQKTELWAWAQKANKQIAAVDEILMRSISKGLIQVGTTPDTIPEGDLIESYQRLTGVSGEHALVGCFDYRGREAFYVTNNSLDSADTVTLNFEEEVDGYTVINAEKSDFASNSVQIELQAGEGALVVLNQK